MTLQMNYQEKFEQGLERGLERGLEQANRQSAMRMLRDGDLPLEKIAMYSGLTVEQVTELEKEEQMV